MLNLLVDKVPVNKWTSEEVPETVLEYDILIDKLTFFHVNLLPCLLPTAKVEFAKVGLFIK